MFVSVRPRSARDLNANRNERETDAQGDLLTRHESQIARFEHTAQRRQTSECGETDRVEDSDITQLTK